ncbi:MAG: GIY-YIG nuclease family protein [Ignavibacteria bacterium]|nr:GIY-YIG nuclease family protein [Ignavibacteria bacterium]
MKFYTYIIKSKIIKRYYIGTCSNLELRLNRHNSGNSRSTKGYIPWEIVYSEEFENKSDAIKRENYQKRQKSVEFIEELIHSKGCPD